MPGTQRKPIVLLDVDGVVADFAGAFLRVYQSVTQEDVDVAAWHKSYDLWHGLGPKSREPVVREVVLGTVARSHFHDEYITPCPGAREGLERIAQIGEVWFVTKPWDGAVRWMHDRERWLARHFGDIDGIVVPERVIHARQKHLVRGDVYVDDLLENVVAWRVFHPESSAVLWKTPHNESFMWGGVAHTNEWDRVVELAQQVAGR
jgi:5'(3')-deoxyribonucleotidase